MLRKINAVSENEIVQWSSVYTEDVRIAAKGTHSFAK